MNPKVSICIPAYNQTKYLKKVLDSVFEQTFTDFELIVSDDSTTEDVRLLVDTYRHHKQFIYYYHNTIPLGSPENWNNSIAKANGEYIKIMHHDDWFTTPDSLAKFIELLEINNNDFAFSGAVVEFESGYIRYHQVSLQQFLVIENNPIALLKANIIGAPSAVIFRNNLNIQFDANLKWIVDLDFYFRLIKKGHKIAYTEETLILTYGHSENITNECFNNKGVELFEYFYFFNKHNINDFSNLRFLLQKCIYYNVKSIKEISDFGYKGPIGLMFHLLFFIRTRKFYDFVRLNLIKGLINHFKADVELKKENNTINVTNSSINKTTQIYNNSDVTNSQFGKYNKIGSYSYLSNVIYGDYSYNSIRCTFLNVKIGKFCSIAQDVSIGLGKHPLKNFVSTHPSFYSIHKQCGFTFSDKQYFNEMGKVEIGNDVWIGANSIILDDIKIGDGAVVAANSVVTENVLPYAIVGGAPAKIIKYRFSEEDIEFLIKTKWWDKEERWLKENFKCMHDIESLKKILK